jgi:hypothetical protein
MSDDLVPGLRLASELCDQYGDYLSSINEPGHVARHMAAHLRSLASLRELSESAKETENG